MSALDRRSADTPRQRSSARTTATTRSGSRSTVRASNPARTSARRMRVSIGDSASGFASAGTRGSSVLPCTPKWRRANSRTDSAANRCRYASASTATTFSTSVGAQRARSNAVRTGVVSRQPRRHVVSAGSRCPRRTMRPGHRLRWRPPSSAPSPGRPAGRMKRPAVQRRGEVELSPRCHVDVGRQPTVSRPPQHRGRQEARGDGLGTAEGLGEIDRHGRHGRCRTAGGSDDHGFSAVTAVRTAMSARDQ